MISIVQSSIEPYSTLTTLFILFTSSNQLPFLPPFHSFPTIFVTSCFALSLYVCFSSTQSTYIAEFPFKIDRFHTNVSASISSYVFFSRPFPFFEFCYERHSKKHFINQKSLNHFIISIYLLIIPLKISIINSIYIQDFPYI